MHSYISAVKSHMICMANRLYTHANLRQKKCQKGVTDRPIHADHRSGHKNYTTQGWTIIKASK